MLKGPGKKACDMDLPSMDPLPARGSGRQPGWVTGWGNQWGHHCKHEADGCNGFAQRDGSRFMPPRRSGQIARARLWVERTATA